MASHLVGAMAARRSQLAWRPAEGAADEEPQTILPLDEGGCLIDLASPRRLSRSRSPRSRPAGPIEVDSWTSGELTLADLSEWTPERGVQGNLEAEDLDAQPGDPSTGAASSSSAAPAVAAAPPEQEAEPAPPQQADPGSFRLDAPASYVAEYNFAAELEHGVDVSAPTPKKGSSLTTGSILDHCRGRIDYLIGKFGGPELCIFKVGIASNLLPRYDSHIDEGYCRFVCLLASRNLALIEMLEAALVAVCEKHRGCRNTQGGGDGGLQKRTHYGEDPVFFAYIAVARADAAIRPGVPSARLTERARGQRIQVLRQCREQFGGARAEAP